MEKPDLDKMWETWIRLGPLTGLTAKLIQDAIRDKIYPTVSRLKNEGKIKWYHFLLHPCPRNPNNGCFHIRFSVREDVKTVEDLNLLEYCVWTKKVDPPLRNISGINKALLKNEEIEEAWRIIGEQSEWIINLINIHKEGSGWIPVDQFVQFMHFFTNMMGLGFRAKISLTF